MWCVPRELTARVAAAGVARSPQFAPQALDVFKLPADAFDDGELALGFDLYMVCPRAAARSARSPLPPSPRTRSDPLCRKRSID